MEDLDTQYNILYSSINPYTKFLTNMPSINFKTYAYIVFY